MLAGAYGEGGAFGELYSMARRIVDRDVESWTAEWSGTAERVETIAQDCLSGGHVVSAREAFLRASLYWRTGLFFLDNNDPRQLAMYKRHRACFRQAAALFRVVRALDGGEAHCTMNNPSLKHQIEFDWLDEVFK